MLVVEYFHIVVLLGYFIQVNDLNTYTYMICITSLYLFQGRLNFALISYAPMRMYLSGEPTSVFSVPSRIFIPKYPHGEFLKKKSMHLAVSQDGLPLSK